MHFFKLFFLFLFLCSCSLKPSQSIPTKSVAKIKTSEIKDGPPTGPIPVFFFFKPKNEPISHYGNPGTYAVDGKTYKVLNSSNGYKARGIASWYGTKFHQKRTSSGDKYNMYAFTAAHTTLPLPTYLKVKNLKNGREIIVKVNDRGPFHSDRLIDLSFAAASKLGVFPIGTALVEIEALKTGNRVAHYYLQTGAYSSEKLARNLKAKLSKLTPSPVKIEKYSQRYIVKVGPLATRQMSESLRAKLMNQGLKGSFTVLQ
ncbi:MAG: septal ring lytic transglycosylase RlpA family protein [Tatlockia sp.]|nr:septal ring lytic transglycosylase RlpA family protein [Tatlockia sp.]